jgi:flagellar motility protein MotE (MotC chaperone)
MKSLNNRGSYVLLTLGFLFAVGAAVRFLPSNLATAAEALAAGTHASEEDTHEVVEAAAAPEARPIDEVCFTAETAAAITAEQELIAAQEDQLQEETLALKARALELNSRTAELSALQETLEARWKEMQTASDEDIMHLARMYGSMKPDQAAAIFDQMEPDFAGNFLRLMRSEQAGLIMASMETRKAYAVSLKLAELNADIRDSAASN